MEIRDWFILIFTFFVGILCGLYLYVTVYKPTYEFDTVATQDETRDFSVSGEMYGGCIECPKRFKVLSNQSYRYLVNDVRTGRESDSSGTLPDTLFDAVAALATEATLQGASRPQNRGTCMSYVDGIDYTYTIVRDGVEYVLDTCTTSFDTQSTLGKTLNHIWNYMDAPNEYRFTITNVPTDNEDRWSVRQFIEKEFEDAGF